VLLNTFSHMCYHSTLKHVSWVHTLSMHAAQSSVYLTSRMWPNLPGLPTPYLYWRWEQPGNEARWYQCWKWKLFNVTVHTSVWRILNGWLLQLIRWLLMNTTWMLSSLQAVTVHTSVWPMCIWDVHIVEPGCGWVLNVIFHTWTRATLNTTGHCNYVYTK